MATHVHRVIVRGFFDGLDADQIERLREAQPDHDILRSAFTAAGTLTYGPDVAAFSFRFEVRTSEDDEPDRNDRAIRTGTARAEALLRELGTPHKHLRATASDLADMWHG